MITELISPASTAENAFIGYYSHCLKLAVEVYVRLHQPVLSKINFLMVLQPRNKYCGHLTDGGCNLKLVRLFTVQWAGIFIMIQRYILLRLHLATGVRLLPVLVLLPSPLALSLSDDLKKMESVSRGLDKNIGSVFEARAGYHRLMNVFPTTIT